MPTRRKAYRFRLEAKPHQRMLMGQFAGCRRWVWNHALAHEKELLAAGERVEGYADLCKLLTAWRATEEWAWLADAPVHTQQQTLRDLVRAIYDAFDPSDPKRFPTYKKKGRDDSFRYPDPKQFRLDPHADRIFLPKLGWVRFRKSREIEGTLKTVTISREGEHWFISIQVEVETEIPQHPSTSEVGIDRGVAVFAALSDGQMYEPASPLKESLDRLARLQRDMARKVKFSSNWKKQKARIARLHHRVACQRSDFLHQTSHEISKNHAVVALEDLPVQNMSRSAKGTVARPGRNVRAKAGLNRAILDQGWGEFQRQVEYKLLWRGGRIVLVNPAYTSQRCSECGHVHEDNRVSRDVFRCVRCGHTEHADVNAAKNVHAAGRAVSACGGVPVGAPVKQEPALAAD